MDFELNETKLNISRILLITLFPYRSSNSLLSKFVVACVLNVDFKNSSYLEINISPITLQSLPKCEPYGSIPRSSKQMLPPFS